MPSEKVEQLIEELSNLTVLEVAELSKALQDKWGVSAGRRRGAGRGRR